MFCDDFKYVGSTTAHGYHYYSKKYDVVVIIYSVITRVFSNRISGSIGKDPCRFEYQYEFENKN